jgi:hypothetical protein
MNTKTVGFLAFIFGAAAGSIATWQLVKKRYQQIADDEIESVKEAFTRRVNEIEELADEQVRHVLGNSEDSDEIEAEGKAAQARNKADIATVASISQKKKYTDYSKYSNKGDKEVVMTDEPEEDEDDNGIRIITPDEFGEMGNEKITLFYWADEVLSYEDGDIPKNISDLVGDEFPDHFGEYEEDSVFVRNEEIGVDYEILLDTRKYSKVFPKIT